jgi:hypothetical protein
VSEAGYIRNQRLIVHPAGPTVLHNSSCCVLLLSTGYFVQQQYPAPYLSIHAFNTVLPVPQCAMDFYGDLLRFVRNTPKLRWTGPADCVGLDPNVHMRLRRQAGVLDWDDSSQGPGAARLVSAGNGGSAAAAAAAGQLGSELPEVVRIEVRRWLRRMALLLPLTDPPTRVPRRVVRERSPFPDALLDYFRTADRLYGSIPGLHCDPVSMLVSLEPALHRELRREAAAAAGGGGGDSRDTEGSSGSAARRGHHYQPSQQQGAPMPPAVKEQARAWLQ